MATYPDFTQLVPSRRVTDPGLELFRSKSGKARIRGNYSRVEKAFQVVHELTPEEYAQFDEFYETNLRQVFDFVWQKTGQTYQCRFAPVPIDEEELSGVMTRVTLMLLVV